MQLAGRLTGLLQARLAGHKLVGTNLVTPQSAISGRLQGTVLKFPLFRGK